MGLLYEASEFDQDNGSTTVDPRSKEHISAVAGSVAVDNSHPRCHITTFTCLLMLTV